MKKIYLEDIPLDEATARFRGAIDEEGLGKILSVEKLPLNEKLVGRILAETVWAKISSPHYHASAMDGFAVRSDSTSGASDTAPVSLSYETP